MRAYQQQQYSKSPSFGYLDPLLLPREKFLVTYIPWGSARGISMPKKGSADNVYPDNHTLRKNKDHAPVGTYTHLYS